MCREVCEHRKSLSTHLGRVKVTIVNCATISDIRPRAIFTECDAQHNLADYPLTYS